MNRPLALLTTLPLALAIAACSTPQASGPAPSASGTTTPAPAKAPSTQAGTASPAAPVAPMSASEASLLREKAAGILTAVASVQTTDTTDPAANALRANAIEGLLPMPGRLEPILRAAFTDKSIGIRSIAAMTTGKARIRSLVDALQPLTYDPSPLVQAAAAFALERNGASADLNVISAMLNSDNTQYRALAAFILGELGNKSAIPMLSAAAAKPSTRGYGVRDKLMRLQIAEALVKLGKADAIDEVRAALYPAQAEDIEATALAIQIIGQVRDTDSRPQLQNLIADTYSSNNPMPIEVRLAAAANFSRLSNMPADRAKAAAFAEAYTTDQSAPIRAQAAAALGETRNSACLPKLSTLLADPDEQVRISAAAAILKITDGR